MDLGFGPTDVRSENWENSAGVEGGWGGEEGIPALGAGKLRHGVTPALPCGALGVPSSSPPLDSP